MHNRVIPAIGEHIAGDCVGRVGGSVNVGVDEAFYCGVVIARLQVVEAGLVIVVIAAITKRVEVGKGRAGSLLIDDAGSGRIGNPDQLAPCVILFASETLVNNQLDLSHS